MNNDNLSEKDKVILQGRIYPAIQSCVQNRYYLLLGIFAYYSFIFTSPEFQKKINANPEVSCLISLIFTVFIVHNLMNYWLNSIEQKEKEGDKRDSPTMEISFFSITFLLIWGAQYFIFQTARGIPFWISVLVAIAITFVAFWYCKKETKNSNKNVINNNLPKS